MSDDRAIETLKRRLDRHIKWGAAAREHAQMMLSDDPLERNAGTGWWRATLNEPRIVLSEMIDDPQPYALCRRRDGCVCGGDTARVRAGCGHWRGD